MGLKKRVASFMGAIMMTSMLGTGLNVFAEVGGSDVLHTIDPPSDVESAETTLLETTETSTTTSTDSTTTTAASSSSITPIHYDVPVYRQNDTTSSWYNLKINNSSSLMSKSGCLITSFAMLRSYQTGTSIDPAMMMQSYSNATGVGVVYAGTNNSSMIVPTSASNYGWSVYGKNVVNGTYEISDNQVNSQELFKLLYDKLQNGPVIFGGYKYKNSRSASNHWIVVTGYTGNGQTFSASDFTINDSGSVNNFTLAEYQVGYPYWDRIIYMNAPVVSTVEAESTNATDTTNTTNTTNTTDVAETTETTTTVEEVTVESLKGDINADGKVDTYDLLIFRKYVLDMIEINEELLANNDLDDDGEVDVKDYLQLKIKIYNNN